MFSARNFATNNLATTATRDSASGAQLERLLDHQGWTTLVEDRGTDVQVTWFDVEQANEFLRATARFMSGPNLYRCILGTNPDPLPDPANAGPRDWKYYLEPQDVPLPDEALDDVPNICLVAHILIPRNQIQLVVRRLLALRLAACAN